MQAWLEFFFTAFLVHKGELLDVLINSFNKYMSAHYVPGAVAVVRDTVKNAHKAPSSVELSEHGPGSASCQSR